MILLLLIHSLITRYWARFNSEVNILVPCTPNLQFWIRIQRIKSLWHFKFISILLFAYQLTVLSSICSLFFSNKEMKKFIFKVFCCLHCGTCTFLFFQEKVIFQVQALGLMLVFFISGHTACSGILIIHIL